MKKRIVRMLGASALVAGLFPLTACATPYAYGDHVRTSVTYTHGARGYDHGRHYHAPRYYYYAPPRFYSPRAYSRWYWNQPHWWRKRNPHRWDGHHHHDRDRDHDHRRDNDHRWHDRD